MTRALDAIRLTSPIPGSPGREADVGRLQGQPVARQQQKTSETRYGKATRTGKDERADELSQRSDAPTAKRSLEDEILDFTTPNLAGSTVLRRSVPILRYCISDLIPELEGGDQLRGLARSLMEEEIERHSELMARLQKETET